MYITYDVSFNNYVPFRLQKIQTFLDEKKLKYIWNIEKGVWEINEKYRLH